MFWFLVKYSLKEAIRSKATMFWTLLFPFVLATVYGAVLLNLDDKKMMVEPIPIMVEDKNYKMVFDKITLEEGKPMFEVKAYENPEESLKEGKIIGFIKGSGKEAEVVLKQGDVKATILYNMTNRINHTYQAVEEIMKEEENREKLASLFNDISKSGEIEIKNGMEGKNKKRFVSYFYSLMAMICFGAMSFGVVVVEDNSVISDRKSARRRAVSAISKSKMIFADFVASILVNLTSTLILFVYIRYGIGVEFGGDNLKILAGLILGNIMAILMGMLVSLSIKAKTDTKISISAVFYVFSSALAGMMVTSVSGFINDKMPIVNHINPATILTKMFTSLYLYEGSEMYFKYFLNAGVFCIICLGLVMLLMRRRSYDSI